MLLLLGLSALLLGQYPSGAIDLIGANELENFAVFEHRHGSDPLLHFCVEYLSIVCD